MTRCLAAVAAAVLAGPAAAADPTGPAVVPPDAAAFVHVDLARLKAGAVVPKILAANREELGDLPGGLRRRFGDSADHVRTVTAFWPSLRTPIDTGRFGVVVEFDRPFDRAAAAVRQNDGATLHALSDRLAVVLVRLGPEFAAVRKPDPTAPLAAALALATAGSHAVVVGGAPGRWADDLRGGPAARPVLGAAALALLLDEPSDLTADLRVYATSSAAAKEAAEALKGLTALAGLPLLRPAQQPVGDEDDPFQKDRAAVVRRLLDGLKAAAVTASGNEARAVVRVPTSLPFAGAVTAVLRDARRTVAAGNPSNNLKQIALAMHSYHDANGKFPPAAIRDKDGKPLLSWRVELLPYLEQNALYQQIKRDEPWDSPHNQALLGRMPAVFELPGTSRAGATRTYFRLFVGNGAAFDTDKGGRLQDITDGTSNTLMVVTAAEAVPWTKPDDLAFDPEQDMNALLGFRHPSGCWVAICDGSVRRFRRPLDRNTLNATITRAGGEVVELP